MKETELKKRIEETKEKMTFKWATFEERDLTEARLERLEQLYSDLYDY